MMQRLTDWKKEAQKQWNQTPCGETEGDKEKLDYFLAVERHRYEEYAPWMKPFFKFDRYSSKRVLEIGYGQGTDLCQFAQAGADCFGVDITQRHFELATENLRLRGLRGKLFLEDASKLHFEDNTFDVVYSFGVLHHTPDTIRCISEGYRVLKPGGEFIIGLYHRGSAFHVFSVLLTHGIILGKLKSLGYGADYHYPHQYEGAYVAEDYLPEKLLGKTFFEPSERGFEREIKKRMDYWKALKEKGKNSN